MKNLILKFSFIIFFSYTGLFAQDKWQQIKTGPYGAMVYCITQSSDTFFAGTLGGGIFGSTNFGDSWSFVSEGLPFINVQELLFYNGRIFASDGQTGIYTSDDFGDSWKESSTGLTNMSISSIVGLEGKIFCSTRQGVFYSTDKGDSWTKRSTGINADVINNLFVHYNALYVATESGIYVSGNFGESWGALKNDGSYQHVAVNGNNIFIATNYQVYMTSDNGQHWITAENVLGNGVIYSLYSSGSYVFAGRSTGLYVSTYSGGWESVHSTFLGQRVYDIKLVNNFIYTGTSSGFYYSQNFSGKWKESNEGLLNERVISMLKDSNAVYVGLQTNGAFKTTDSGESWTDLNIGNKRVSLIYKNDIGLFIVANDTMYFSFNEGIQWEYRSYGLDGKVIYQLIDYNGKFYACTNDGIFVSTNSGLKWDVQYRDFRGMDIKSFYVAPNGYIYLSTNDKILISWDEGNTWNESYYGMKSYNITKITGNDTMTIAGSYPDDDFDADLYLTFDDGRNWKSAGLNLSHHYIKDIILHENSIFITVNAIDTSQSIGVLFSSNFGESWKILDQGLTIKDINNILISDGEIWAGTHGSGVFKRVLPEPMFPLELIYPQNDAENIVLNPMLDWETKDDADFYNVQISESGQRFDQYILTEYSTTISEFRIPDTILDYSSRYYWRVNYSQNGNLSEWSEIFNFTTEEQMVTFTNLLYPEDQSTGIDVLTDLIWEQLENADEYIIHLADNTDFLDNIINLTVSSSTYNVQKGKLDFNTTYYWKVRAVINGVERDWSEVFSFTTQDINLVAPELLFPVAGATGIPLNSYCEWNSVDQADQYILQIALSDDFSELVLNDTLSNTIYNFQEDLLLYETDYYWHVKAKYADYTGEWSETRNFRTETEVSVKDINILKQSIINISPNPANNNISIDYILPFDTKLSLYIVDLSGKWEQISVDDSYYKAGTKKYISTTLNEMSSGSYYIVFRTKYGDISRKIAVIR
jgi:photosystem II stability/assembly factor-like uncharacterized protein